MLNSNAIYNQFMPLNTRTVNIRAEPNVVAPNSAGKFIRSPNMIDEISLGNITNYPKQGVINSSNHHIFWFLQISDTQMVWNEWNKEDLRSITDFRVVRLRTFFNTTQKIISPLFIVNTGDLTDSIQDYLRRTPGQRQGEWAYYNETMHELGMNASFYFDMPGNHDVYRSPGYTNFLTYSMSGAAFHTDQYMLTLDLGWGTYRFYTPENYGLEFPFALGGVMDQSELDWFESKLKTYENQNNLSISFGHHPISDIQSQRTRPGKDLLELMEAYGIDVYLYGHIHENKFEQYGTVPTFAVAKIDEGESYYRIIAVDEDGISTTEQSANQWPTGIITCPIDEKLVRTDQKAKENAKTSKIRALAWDPKGIRSVEWQYDSNGQWLSMDPIEGPLFEGNFNTELADGKPHIIEIRVTNLDNEITIKSITFNSNRVDFFNWSLYIYWFILGFIGICAVSMGSLFYKRLKNPAKFGKKPESLVDKQSAKLLLMKLAFFLLVPLNFTLLNADTLTVVFSLFLIGKDGIIISDVLLIFSGVLSIGFVPQVLSLSRKYQRVMRGFTRFNIFLEGFLFLYFLIHFPTVAWIAPGFYLMLYTDIKLLKAANGLQEN
jgi:3',5'-cyclic AMP phosphodiesterase CpdA